MFIQNKYSNWYHSIIDRAKARAKLAVYTERHHIIPRSISNDDSEENIVALTAKEHFICHLLLPKALIDPTHKRKMWYAVYRMAHMKTKTKYKGNARTYAYLREYHAQTNKDRPGPNKGKKLSEEWRANISKGGRGIKQKPRTVEHSKKLSFPKSEETKRKLSEARLGKSWGHHSGDTKQRMSEWQKGIPKPKYTCIHCGKETSLVNIKRWHNDNCKTRIV